MLSSEIHGLLYETTGGPRTSLTRKEEARSAELLDEIEKVDKAIEAEVRVQGDQKMLVDARRKAGVSADYEGRTANAAVTREGMIYGGGSPNSYYYDMSLLQRGALDMHYAGAAQRMTEWSHQVEKEVASGSEFGKASEQRLQSTIARNENRNVTEQVLREVRDRGRVGLEHKTGVPGSEARTGINTGGGPTVSVSGGAAAFITPIFGAPYIPYREYGRAFADQCFQGQMPDTGLALYKPQVTGGAGINNDTDANIVTNGVTEVDPAVGYATASLTIFEGQVTLTQAILDRMAPDYQFDAMCEDQLHRKYDPKFDAYALSQALANATTQSWAGNSGAFEMVAHTLPGSGGFYGQVSLAKAGMRKLEGTVLNATHLFMDPSLYEFMAAWADSQGRPVFVPNYGGPFNALANTSDGDAGIEGATGTRFNGLSVFTDANIPTTGATAALYQAIVGCLNEVEVYESAAINRVLPQTNASKLEVILQRYSYATVFVNYPGAVTAIQGTGFSGLAYSG